MRFQRVSATILCAVTSSLTATFAHRLPLPAANEERSTAPPDTCQVISPSPPGYVCDQKGIVQSSAPPLGRTFVNTIDKCRNICLRREFTKNDNFSRQEYPGCGSFTWDSVNGTCSIYKEDLYNLGWAQGSANTLFGWDAACYDCPEQCPQSKGYQLLDNGDFENDPTIPSILPWVSYPAGTIASAPGLNSSRAFQCVAKDGKDAKRSSVCTLTQAFNTCPNPPTPQQYVMAYSSRIREFTQNAYRFSFENPGASSYQESVPQSQAGVWKTFEYYFGATRSLGSVSLSLLPTGGFTKTTSILDIDNAQVYPVTYPVPVRPNSDLIKNGGFENGRLGPWKLGSSQGVKLKVISPGLASQKALSVALTQANTYGSFLISQDIKTVPGERYLFSFDRSSEDPFIVPETFSFQVTIRPGGTSQQLDYAYSWYFDYFGSNYERIFVAKSKVTQVLFGLGFQSESPSQDGVTVDNIRVERVNGEPY